MQCVFHSIRFKVNKGWSTAVLLFLCLYVGKCHMIMVENKNPRKTIALRGFRLDYQDSNLDKQNQNLLCCHYTIVQTSCVFLGKLCKDKGFSGYKPNNLAFFCFPISLCLTDGMPRSEKVCGSGIFLITCHAFNFKENRLK